MSWFCKTKRRIKEKKKSADYRVSADQSVDTISVANWDHAVKIYSLETERQEQKQTVGDLIFSEEKEPIIKCLGSQGKNFVFLGKPQKIS